MAIKPENVLSNFKKAGEAAAQKAADFVERSKITLEITGKESEINELFKELGKATYEAKKNNVQGMTPEALIAIIDGKMDEIEELKTKRMEKSDPVCPSCGKDIEDFSHDFCPRCGTPLPKKEDDGCGCGDDCDCDGNCGCGDDCTCKDEAEVAAEVVEAEIVEAEVVAEQDAEGELQ